MNFARATSLFALLLATSALAQSTADKPASRLQAVQVSGSAKFHSAQIAPATGLHVGDQITRDDIQRGADTLAALGLFANVQYRFTTEASGVSIEYLVADAPTVPVLFDNFPWFTDDDLVASLKTSVPLFNGTLPDHGTVLDDVSSALARQLVARGVAPSVSHDLVTLPGRDGPVLRFRAEGTTAIVQSVEFSDALAGSARGIQDRLGDLVGKAFSRSTLELFEFDQVRPVYFEHGCLRVAFGQPSARVEGKNKVIVRAPIDSGPAFTWGGVAWSGNTAIPSVELDKLVELSPGLTADGMKIQSTWESARQAFGRHGYLDLDLNPVPHFDDASKRVTYEVKITEGPQYHMGNLVLTGLSLEGERRIRAGWKIPSGAVFDTAVYDEFLISGIKQSFAGLPVHYEKVDRFLQKDAANAKLDVMLDFQ